MFLADLQIEKAGTHFKRAIELDVDLKAASKNLERAIAIDDMQQHAQKSGTVPTLHCTDVESAEGTALA